MKSWLLGIAFITLISPLGSAQTDASEAILRVGAQTLTTADLEHVKTLLPLERFKTTPGRTRLMDAIYLEFLIAKTKLEAAGLKAVTPEEIATQAQQFEPSSADLSSAGYTPETLAERTLMATNIRNFVAAQVAATQPLKLSPWFASQSPQTPDEIAAAQERRLTSQITVTPLPLFRVRSMLLENPRAATAITDSIRSEADFIAAARRFSLVRREVGGAYAKDAPDARVAVTQLEPELQIAVLNARKTGLLRVAAPFGRVWLVYLSPIPKPRVTLSLTFFSAASISGPVFFGAGPFKPTELVKLIADDTTPVEWIDEGLEPRIPTVAEVGAARLQLTDYFVARLLGEADPKITESFFDAGPTSSIAQFVAGWLEARATSAALPYNGAGTERGLAAYIAARAKVSETQLKAYYLSHRSDYQFAADRRVVSCEFRDALYALKWRKTVLFAPFEIWAEFSRNSVGVRCDANPRIVPLPPLPAFSRGSLTPIAGGFVTPIVGFKKKFYFVSLYGFYPAPLTKPFVLVRDRVEQTYRKLVGTKRLEAFKAELFQRAGAKNLLADALAQLDQP